MKKSNLLIISLFILSLLPMRGDEGMWLLPLLDKLNGKKMAEIGITLSADDIYNTNSTSLKDAIVHFGGGCTGEIVSRNGLLFTNHHCGYGSIQALSTVEHNYLKDGYWAMNLKEELPAEGLTVTFLDKFTDITKEFEKIVKKSKGNDSIVKVKYNELIENATKGDKHLQASIVAFYGGNTYYLITYRVYEDIRFVGAPPSSIGKFGADTDNWMWPRHTGDFSVFRVYADKDNNPAGYSEDNVPYSPKQFLKISLKGVQENDPTMIIGYPGRTNRFMTSSELIETRDISNAIRIYVRGERQELMMEDMQADPKVMIQYASKYSGSSNGWKKWIGMGETFKKLGVEERRKSEEAKFTEWVNKKPSRVAKYGEALNKVNSAIDARKDAMYNNTYASESIFKVEIMKIANTVTGAFNRMRKADDSKKESIKKELLEKCEGFYKNYSAPTDKKITQRMIEIYMEKVSKEFYPTILKEIDSVYSGDITKYVDELFANSIFTDYDKVIKVINENPDFDLVKKDPATLFGVSMHKHYAKMMMAYKDLKDPYEGKKEYIAGTLEMRKGEAIYPDANSTMRLTYGSVLAYSPKDAVIYDYYTTLDGVMEKEDPNNWEFVVPAKLKELWENKDFGQYAMSNGKMPVAFLSNNDITGGNSGSPILNGNGELLGLAFDGNWESMSSDIIFEPELQRCINVDVRYVLFIIDKFGGAGYLLDEMELVK